MKAWDQALEILRGSDKKKKKALWLDFVGILCGVFLVAVAVVSIVQSHLPVRAGVRDSEVPASAQTLTGTAMGRNGNITVAVVTDGTQIYQIKILEQSETENIGTVAVKELPGTIYRNQSLAVDGVSGATISSDAIKAAVINALERGGISPAVFGGSLIKVEQIAHKVETNSGVTIMLAADWSDRYPEIYASWASNADNDQVTDYLTDYPMLRTLYEPYGFSRDYNSARGHMYTIDDILETERIGPNSKASCWTCKTPQYTNMVNEQGVSVYTLPFADLIGQITEPISCYTCHANTPGELTVTHTYLIDGVGEDFENIDAATLSCGQCHNEYYFDPANGATTLPHDSLASMSPDAILAYFNDGTNFSTGEPFTDYVNPRTGVHQIKVQHPELETFLSEGSPHRGNFTCADCHMGEAVSDDGTRYISHYLISPLENPTLIENVCSSCHTDLESEVRAVQEEVERRTYEVGYLLQDLTEKLASAVESGNYSEEELDKIRALARDAQFYWDFVFVENAEGVHNPELSYKCLDKAEELTKQAFALFKS